MEDSPLRAGSRSTPLRAPGRIFSENKATQRRSIPLDKIKAISASKMKYKQVLVAVGPCPRDGRLTAARRLSLHSVARARTHLFRKQSHTEAIRTLDKIKAISTTQAQRRRPRDAPIATATARRRS